MRETKFNFRPVHLNKKRVETAKQFGVSISELGILSFSKTVLNYLGIFKGEGFFIKFFTDSAKKAIGFVILENNTSISLDTIKADGYRYIKLSYPIKAKNPDYYVAKISISSILTLLDNKTKLPVAGLTLRKYYDKLYMCDIHNFSLEKEDENS